MIPKEQVTLAIEVFVISTAVYLILRFLRGTVGGGILIGLAWLLGVLGGGVALARQFRLEFQILPTLFNWVLTLSAFAMVIIFQPELRRGLVRLGRNPWQELFGKSEQQVVDAVVDAAVLLSREKTGALIALEREVGLRSYIESSKAVKVDAEVTTELLRTIFNPSSALHDGGVVIRGRRVAAAGCFFPLSDSPRLTTDFGSRHRAALGLSEEADSIVVVCSEETGAVSVAMNGEMTRDLDGDALRDLLRKQYVRNDAARRGKRRGNDRSLEDVPHARPRP